MEPTTTSANAAESPPGPATSPRARGRLDLAIASGILATLIAVYWANGDVLPTNDATPSVYAAASLLQEGRYGFRASRDPGLFEWNVMRAGEIVATLRLMEIDADIEGHPARRLWAAGVLVPHAPYWLAATVRKDPVTGEPLFVSTFGPGTPLAALPVLAAVRPFSGDLRTSSAALWFGAKAAAAILVALSAGLVFLAARRRLAPAAAAGLAMAYGLGTGVWSTSSQTLWQHAPDAFLVALGAYGLLRAAEDGRWSALAGAAFAMATACRPTSAIFAVSGAVWLLLASRRALLPYLAGAAPFALAVAGYNLYWFGSPLLFGQTVVGPGLALALTGTADQWQTPLWVGVPGLLASPSRGLFVFSPFLLAALPGAVLAFRRPEHAALRPLAIAAALTVLVAGKHYDWWGGWAYGYRHIVDLAPALALLVVPAAGWILASAWRRATFGALVAWSIAVQAIGAFAYDGSGWNARPALHVLLPTGETVKVPEEEAVPLVRGRGGRVVGREVMEIAQPPWRHRLWSLRDSQIAYYAARFGPAREIRRRSSRGWIAGWSHPPPPPEERR